jgi:hypothetical protein
MKMYSLLGALVLLWAFDVNAKEPFTSSSDGYDWNSASSSYKMRHCEFVAESMRKNGFPNVTADYLYGGLTSFYQTDDASILRVAIVRTIARLAAATK